MTFSEYAAGRGWEYRTDGWFDSTGQHRVAHRLERDEVVDGRIVACWVELTDPEGKGLDVWRTELDVADAQWELELRQASLP